MAHPQRSPRPDGNPVEHQPSFGERTRARATSIWHAVRRSPARTAVAIGVVIAAVVIGGALGALTRQGTGAAIASSSPSPGELSSGAPPPASGETESFPAAPESAPSSPSPTAPSTPSPSPSPSDDHEPTPPAGNVPEPTPPVGKEPEPTPAASAAGVGGPTAPATVTLAWERIPAMPSGSRGAIADVVELPSGKIGVVLWATDRTNPVSSSLVLAYDPDRAAWTEIDRTGDAMPIGTNSEFVTVDDDVLHPVNPLDRNGLELWSIDERTDAWAVTDDGVLDEGFSSATEVTATVIGHRLYVPEHLWSPSRTTRFLVYDPATGGVTRTASTSGHLYEAFGDGRSLYAGDSAGGIHRYDVAGDTWSEFAPAPPEGSPSYRHAVGTGDEQLWVPVWVGDGMAVWYWSPSTARWVSVEIPGATVADVHLLAAQNGSLYLVTPERALVARSLPAD